VKKLFLFLLINFLLSDEFNFNSENSYIKYIGQHPLHSWIGISNNFEFNLNLNENTFSIYISARLDSFDSNNENRDSNMLYYTESLKYPNVTFKSDLIKYTKLKRINIIKGTLNFHGIEKQIIAKVEILENNSTFIGKCNFKIKLSDFNIERPKLLMLSIENIIELETKIELSK